MMIHGLRIRLEEVPGHFEFRNTAGNGCWVKGKDGVKAILGQQDGKADYIVFEDKTIVYVHSAMGYPAMYDLKEDQYEGPAEYILMDLDGTSVRSETFWMWIIERTTAQLLGYPGFTLENEDIPHVSGHSVSEHLQYCINKYCPEATVERAREIYFRITRFEMNEIMAGRGRKDAFIPSPGLKDFLLTLKAHQIKIGLVTSGLYEKAWPEILSAFRTLGMGDPLDFYDAVITAGFALGKGQTGTLGELAPKPHPWLYAETARVGLGVTPAKRSKVIGIEDSSAGVLSIRLAGFRAIGIEDGNIRQSGAMPLVYKMYKNLMDAVDLIISG
ncbi:MAG: HAD family phosphatase [Bacteroidales bacterium]|nr:HAD family phosphatase [Bacteroidales bacterium]